MRYAVWFKVSRQAFDDEVFFKELIKRKIPKSGKGVKYINRMVSVAEVYNDFVMDVKTVMIEMDKFKVPRFLNPKYFKN